MIDINDYTDDKGRFDGRYLLIRPLSTDGATADVWLSLDLNTVSMTDGDKIDQIARLSDEEIEKLGLMVAIKIYRPQNALDIEGEQRFRDEYMIVFNCHHANLIHPTNFSICKDTPYLVLPFCKRGSSELLIGNKFSDDDIWKYIQDVASGLAYLHALEPPIIHQDVKPANVLLDDTGHYALTDFGISAQRGGVHGYYFDDENSGTMAYMAPERFQKDAEPMAQSDIWGFGATLCEILTGKVPFGESGGRTQAEAGLSIPVIPGVSNDLQRLIHDCLEPQPGNRPTAQQIADAARARQYPIKNRKGVWIALATIVVLLCAAGIYYAMRQTPPLPDVNNVLPDDEQCYSYALQLLDYSYNTDSIRKGMRLMDSLSDMEYIPAMYEVARTIGLNKVGTEPSYRRLHLGIDVDENKVPTSIENRKRAELLLKRILAHQDSTFAQENTFSAYTMSQYYLNSMGLHKENADSIDYYFDESIRWAEIAGDPELVKKLKQYKNESQKKD